MIEDISRHADQCVVMSRARDLVAWVGSGVPVTAKGVLRRADVPDAAKAIGIDVPGWVRTAAEIEELHRPWVVAQAVGLLVLDANRAVPGPGADGDSLRGWLAGLDAVLRITSRDREQGDAEVTCRAVLTALSANPPPARDQVGRATQRILDEDDFGQAITMFTRYRRSAMPVDATLAVLAEFGAVDEEARLTPLGRWAAQQMRARADESVTPDLPASTLLARFADVDDDKGWELAMRWRGRRPASDVASQLLAAAAVATPAERVVAVGVVSGLGDEALPEWQAALDVPELAPHARAILAVGEHGPEPDDAERRWLITEYALVALARDGVEAAHHEMLEHGGLDAVLPSGHPGESVLREAIAGFIASGQQPRMFQVKIALVRVRPPVWRRVLLPASATLGDLHHVLRAVLGWGDDHLHSFTAEGVRYSDPYYNLDDCGDEDAVRLSRVLPRVGSALTYVYDFGDWWEHTITLEKIVDADPATTYPACLTGRGDAPVEDWNPEYPEEPTPFDRDEINRRLVALSGPAQVRPG